jgi:hypothetical protein
MFDSRGRSADPLFGVDAPCADGRGREPAKPFHFAITWTSLTRHLALREAVERASAIASHSAHEIKQPSFTALAGIAVKPRERPEARSDTDARWEMVVPKMVRPDRGSNALPMVPITDNRNRHGYVPIYTPTLDNARQPLLAGAFAAVGRYTRSLLAAPAKSMDAILVWSRRDLLGLNLANGRASRPQVLQLSAPSPSISAEDSTRHEATKDRHAVRELLLAKITSSLRSRSKDANSALKVSHPQERWSEVPSKDEPPRPYHYDQH